MLAVLFNGIINVILFFVKFFSRIFNDLIETYLPDLSSHIVNVTTSITTFFDNLTWPLSIVPTGILNTLVIILTIEIARHTIYISTHLLIRMWNLFQKMKFW